MPKGTIREAYRLSDSTLAEDDIDFKRLPLGWFCRWWVGNFGSVRTFLYNRDYKP